MFPTVCNHYGTLHYLSTLRILLYEQKTEEMKQILRPLSTLYYYQADRRKATAILHIQSLVRGFLARRRVRRQARGWLETLQVITGSNCL